jgi:hypothetical protein
MISIKPLDSELKDAEDFARKYDKGGFGKNVLGVSHSEYIDFIRIGKLCELVFVRILNEKGVTCECSDMLVPCEKEHRKGADLILKSGQEVDIKAGNKPFHVRILVREDQFKAHIHDIYVGAKYVNDGLVEFYGYIMGKDLKNIKPKDFGYGLCRHKLLSELKPIENFIKFCKENKFIE